MSDPSGAERLPSAARYVPVDASDARVARLWGAVSARLEEGVKPARRWVWVTAGAVALAAAGAGAFVFVSGERAPSPWEGAAFETEQAPLTVALADGSTMRLDSSSRVEVSGSAERGVHLSLRRGRIECKVTHRRAPSFVVTADGVEVRVVGTRFSVESVRAGDSSRVEVRVDEGAVEVRSANRPREVQRVEAGRTWSQVTRTEPVVNAQPEAAPQVRSAEVAPPVAPAPDEPSAKPEADTARTLLEEANEHRRAGRLADAARTYETLLSRYPKDGRAGLAAFELGRLRMDRLGDVAGAIQALERAMKLAPGSGFREDAMARLVTAYGRSGNAARCTTARDAYLKHYPEGVHRNTVAKQCGGAL